MFFRPDQLTIIEKTPLELLIASNDSITLCRSQKLESYWFDLLQESDEPIEPLPTETYPFFDQYVARYFLSKGLDTNDEAQASVFLERAAQFGSFPAAYILLCKNQHATENNEIAPLYPLGSLSQPLIKYQPFSTSYFLLAAEYNIHANIVSKNDETNRAAILFEVAYTNLFVGKHLLPYSEFVISNITYEQLVQDLFHAASFEEILSTFESTSIIKPDRSKDLQNKAIHIAATILATYPDLFSKSPNKIPLI